MPIEIKTDIELSDVAKLFYGDDFPNILLDINGNVYTLHIDGASYCFDYSDEMYSIIPPDRRARLAKIAVYDALHAHSGKSMPWGALTGVRPTKLMYECLRNGKTPLQATEVMRTVYRVSQTRANVLQKIIAAQSGKVNFTNEYCNLYVHVPYCTTRCSYCSFVSLPIGKNRENAKKYTELLCDEVKRSVEFLHDRGKKILSVYIGGGTPTALDDESFDKLLSAVGDNECEYTCEAGRPDTVTAEKCDIMRAHGVTRVCVNPQTLNPVTLEKIGRRHSVNNFFEAYDEVKKRGFDINCDLIAGLEDETPQDFINSFNGITALGPQNFTVHSLSKKNGSAIRYSSGENESVAFMLDYALHNCGAYAPYYLYRQKRQAGNLENIGFSLNGCECINNITTMEETVSVMACGAGAISKVVNNGGIARFANMRDVGLYASRYDERMTAKFEFFATAFDYDN